MAQAARIRSIGRGLAVLQAVSHAGALSITEIMRASRMPYATAYRIVQALVAEGWIERDPTRKRYRGTPLLRAFADGPVAPRPASDRP